LRAVGLPWCVGMVLWQWLVAESHRVSLTWHYGAALALGVGLVVGLRALLQPPAPKMGGVRLPWVPALLICVLTTGGLVWLALWHLPSGLLFSGVIMMVLCLTYLVGYVSAPGSVGQRTVLFLLCGGASLALSAFPIPFVVKLSAYLFMIGATFVCLSPVASRALRYHFPAEVFAALVAALGCGAAVHFWVDDGHSWLCAEVLVLWGLFVVCLSTLRLREPSEGSAGEQLLATSETRRWVVSWVVLVAVVFRASGWLGHQSSEKFHFNAAAAVCITGLLLAHRARGSVSSRVQRWMVDMAMVFPPLAVFAWGKLTA